MAQLTAYTLLSKRGYVPPMQIGRRKLAKGVWRMPWLSAAKKDVISCEKLWGVAHTQ